MFIDKSNFIPVPKSSISPSDRKLLEHEKSITLKLEDIYQQEMGIKVVKADLAGGIYQREIIMSGKKDDIPRELAYIKIFIKNLNREARKEILDGKKPFGKILLDHGIFSKRKIKIFFKIYKNDCLLNYVKSDKEFFYGRNYFIFLAKPNKILADVTEIFL